MVPQILDSLVSNCPINISVHIQYQCFHYAMTWENNREIQKVTIKWIWSSNGFWSFWLSLWFISWKMLNDTLLKIWVFVMLWLKKISDPKIPQGVKLQTLLLLWNITSKGLVNHIRNIPKKNIYAELQGGLFFVGLWWKSQTARWSLIFSGNYICKRFDLD